MGKLLRHDANRNTSHRSRSLIRCHAGSRVITIPQYQSSSHGTHETDSKTRTTRSVMRTVLARGSHRYGHFYPSFWARNTALSLIHISEPTRLLSISYAVFCLKK